MILAEVPGAANVIPKMFNYPLKNCLPIWSSRLRRALLYEY